MGDVIELPRKMPPIPSTTVDANTSLLVHVEDGEVRLTIRCDEWTHALALSAEDAFLLADSLAQSAGELPVDAILSETSDDE